MHQYQLMAGLMAQRSLMGLTMRYCARARTPMQFRIRRLGHKQGASPSSMVNLRLWKSASETCEVLIFLMALTMPNEKEISHNMVSWQAHWTYFEMGPLASSIG